MSGREESAITPLPSRRRFLQQLGLGAGALSFGLFGGLTWPQSALAVCEPPGNPGTAKRWRKDCRMILPGAPPQPSVRMNSRN